MRFTHELQFCKEMGKAELNQKHQGRLQEIVEQACHDRMKFGEGYSFARIVWKQRRWLVWFQALDGEITLLSIRPDLL